MKITKRRQLIDIIEKEIKAAAPGLFQPIREDNFRRLRACYKDADARVYALAIASTIRRRTRLWKACHEFVGYLDNKDYLTPRAWNEINHRKTVPGLYAEKTAIYNALKARGNSPAFCSAACKAAFNSRIFSEATGSEYYGLMRAGVIAYADKKECGFLPGVSTPEKLGRHVLENPFYNFPDFIKWNTDAEAVGNYIHAEKGGIFTLAGYLFIKKAGEI